MAQRFPPLSPIPKRPVKIPLCPEKPGTVPGRREAFPSREARSRRGTGTRGERERALLAEDENEAIEFKPAVPSREDIDDSYFLCVQHPVLIGAGISNPDVLKNPDSILNDNIAKLGIDPEERSKYNAKRDI